LVKGKKGNERHNTTKRDRERRENKNQILQ
jgi:hypothetical protein